MRQIFLDTETTGLEHKLGHRIIEIAGVEMCNRRLTRRHFHRYINPQREIDSGAQAVHGISEEFLADKPPFAGIVAEFLDFIRGAELVIHNAPFDVGFLNAELARLDLPPVESVCQGICDTLRLAKEVHPGKKNNLNALCERYGINNSQRTLHGALLDAELLADVYLAMTRGQESLVIDLPDDTSQRGETLCAGTGSSSSRQLRVLVATDEEINAHRLILASIQEASKGGCLWLKVRE